LINLSYCSHSDYFNDNFWAGQFYSLKKPILKYLKMCSEDERSWNNMRVRQNYRIFIFGWTISLSWIAASKQDAWFCAEMPHTTVVQLFSEFAP